MEVYWYYHCALLCRKWPLSPSSGRIVLEPGNRLSSLKKLYVAYQNSIQKRILIYFRSLVISHVTIQQSYLRILFLLIGLLLLHLCGKMASRRLNGKWFYFTLWKWTLLSDLAIIVMERRPIHFTVHVRNVSRKHKVNPLNNLVDFQLWFHSEMVFALFYFVVTIWIRDIHFHEKKNQIPSLVLIGQLFDLIHFG